MLYVNKPIKCVKHAQTPITTSPSYFTSFFFFFLSFGNFFAEGFVVDEDIQELIRDGDNLGKKKKKLKFLKGKLNVSEGGVK